jgi:hypothetical protein
MASDPDSELERAFHDTADAEAAALGPNRNLRKVIVLVVTLVAVIASGVGVGWAIFASTH